MIIGTIKGKNVVIEFTIDDFIAVTKNSLTKFIITEAERMFEINRQETVTSGINFTASEIADEFGLNISFSNEKGSSQVIH